MPVVGRSSVYHTEVLRSLEAHDRDQWDALDAEDQDFYLSSAWLGCVDGTIAEESAFVVVEEDGTPVGGLAAYLVTDEVFIFQDPPHLALAEGGLKEETDRLRPTDEQLRVAELRKKLAPLVSTFYPAAVCVAPYAFSVAAFARAGRRGVIERLVDAFQNLADEWGARMLAFLYVPEEDSGALGATLESRGFLSSVIGAHAILPVEWSDFDGYLGAFSHRPRWHIRRELRGFRDSGLRVEIVDGSALPAIAEDLAVLSAKLMSKYGHGFDVDRERLTFRLIETHLAPFMRLFLIRKGQKIVAFAHFYELRDRLYAAMSGQDYDEVGPRDFAHFNALYYAPIAFAAQRGIREINYGLGDHATKSSRGCRLRHMRGFFDFGSQSHPLRSEIAELIELEDVAHRRLLATNRTLR